jgi:hypothetical protein
MGNGTKKKKRRRGKEGLQIFCKRPRLFTVAIPMEQHGVTQGPKPNRDFVTKLAARQNLHVVSIERVC